MTAFLADGNLLIALVVSDHVHHGMAVEWFEQTEPNLATCPITEGTLIRFLVREGVSAAAATGLLDTVRDQDWHRFWPADLPLVGAQFPGVVGHRQVTAVVRHVEALLRDPSRRSVGDPRSWDRRSPR